jgi:uncharacterized protein YndB with AHSA1/START domain
MSMKSLHDTLVFTREISAPPAAVFAAYADAGQRAIWSAPSDTSAMIYDAADFQVGGADHFRCGSKENPEFNGTTFYLDIVADQRIVSSEVIGRDGKSLSAALTTFDLTPQGKSTTLTFTVQVASFMGADMFKGHEQGYKGALDNLVRHVEREHNRSNP